LTILNALRYALGIFSGNAIFIFCVCRGLRAAPNTFSQRRPKPGNA
jgi:hypothetical protein